LKDPLGLEASNPDGLIIRAIRALKKELPSLCLFADVALDPYTSHGHDGLTDGEKILNDPTIERLIEQSLCLAQSGADFLAPSDMMDGRIGAIRKALDQAGFSSTGLLAYSAKYASSLYGPFRDAVGSHLAFGDKKTYQMDPANVREALLEAALDEEEGADILMIKPALFYLDVIAQLRQNTYRPIAAYHVSGEYAMAFTPSLNPQAILREALLAIKRAGANLIFTYATPLLLPHLPF
jgi:porphobilinogen synthase